MTRKQSRDEKNLTSSWSVKERRGSSVNPMMTGRPNKGKETGIEIPENTSKCMRLPRWPFMMLMEIEVMPCPYPGLLCKIANATEKRNHEKKLKRERMGQGR